MSKRMTSETIIFDTNWLTEADFGEENYLIVSIDYQAYDTLKIIAPPDLVFDTGGSFQEFNVYKLDNFGFNYQTLLEISPDLEISHNKNYSELLFYLQKSYWEDELKGIRSIYIKGVKR